MVLTKLISLTNELMFSSANEAGTASCPAVVEAVDGGSTGTAGGTGGGLKSVTTGGGRGLIKTRDVGGGSRTMGDSPEVFGAVSPAR